MRKLLISSALILSAGAAFAQAPQATDGPGPNMVIEVADAAGAHHLPSSIVNEGGGLHVDGEGTVLLTETVQLDPGRNPGATKGDIEAEVGRLEIGAGQRSREGIRGGGTGRQHWPALGHHCRGARLWRRRRHVGSGRR